MKRVWQTAALARRADGFGVALDGRPLRRPGGGALVVPFEGLAEAIAAEWRGAGLDGGEIGPDDFSLTRLAATAVERVPAARDDLVGQIAAYGVNDLLCYRAEGPEELVALQARDWQPWLDWAAERFGVRLAVGTGVAPVAQPAGAGEVFRRHLAEQSDFALAGLGVAVPATGSLVLGLAMLERAVDAAAAFECAMLDELFQAGRWGEDGEAAARRAGILADLRLCESFWALCA